MTSDYYEYTVLGDYAVALINGDYSHLDDDECLTIDGFEADAIRNAMRAGWHHWHWEIADSAGFARCDICDQSGDCVTLRLVCFSTVREMVKA